MYTWRRAAAIAAVAALLLFAVGGAQAAEPQVLTLSSDAACYTGLAKLKLRQDDCQEQTKALVNLTYPYDYSRHAPWDCLEEMLVSVEGCKITMASLMGGSSLLPNFSCSWIEYQGVVLSGSTGRVASWNRPIPTAVWVLANTDLEGSAAKSARANKPPGWQQLTSSLFSLRGSALFSDGDTIVMRQNDRCNTTYEVVNGRLLDVGTVDASTRGAVVMPSMMPFEPPFIVRGERVRPWERRANGMKIGLIVAVAVLGALLLAALALLGVRLLRAPKTAAAAAARTPFADGVGHAPAGAANGASTLQGAASLEHSAQRHGPSGGI